MVLFSSLWIRLSCIIFIQKATKDKHVKKGCFLIYFSLGDARLRPESAFSEEKHGRLEHETVRPNCDVMFFKTKQHAFSEFESHVSEGS